MYSTQVQEPDKIMTDLAREFSRGIEFTCHCKFPDMYITDGQLMCVNKELMYRARIISTDQGRRKQLKGGQAEVNPVALPKSGGMSPQMFSATFASS